MAYLHIIEGPHQGTHVPLSGKLTIGRNPANGLCLNDSSVSRMHAEIWNKDKYYALVDLGSSNGSIVNDTLLHKLVPRPLYDSDEITIGSSRIIFHAQGDEPPGSSKIRYKNKPDIDIASQKKGTSLSIVMTSGDKSDSRVNATIDASRVNLINSEDLRPDMLAETVKRLGAMVKISVDLGAVRKPQTLVEHIMSGIFDIFPHADRAFVMLRDLNDGQIKPFAARKRFETEQNDEFPVSRTVINTVTGQKQSILLSDAQSDKRFAEQRSVVDLSIRSLMCAPLLCKEDLLGVIGVDTMSGRHAFVSDDLLMLTGIASQAAVAIKNSELFTTVEKESKKRTLLSRYLSKDIVEGILDGTVPFHLHGEKKRGTILFCDIVGFTSMAENLAAVEVFEKLNNYYSVVTEIITGNRGTLHKFGGDMVMAFWNVMYPDNSAEENAVRTGLELQNAVFSFDLDLENEGQKPVFLGIGCNTGEFAGGNIGGSDRMEYTVIGDNINLAQRIEALASRWQVLISSETYEPIKDKCVAIELEPAIVKGRKQPVKVYSVRGILHKNSSLLLDIPVYIMTPDGSVTGNGLLTLYRTVCGEPEIHISSFFRIPPWSTLIIQLDLPEFMNALQLSGKVAAVLRSAHDGRSVYSRIVLTNLGGDNEALAMLKPGTLLKSRKTWQNMKRH